MHLRPLLFDRFLQQYARHQDIGNLRVHVWTNAIAWMAFITILSQIPVRMALPLLGANAGAWWIAASCLYWLLLDITVPLLVLLCSAVLVFSGLIPWGPGHGWIWGVLCPGAIFAASLTVAHFSHVYAHDHADHIKSGHGFSEAVDAVHAVLWGPFHFGLCWMLRTGYRPALRAKMEDAERSFLRRRRRTVWRNWGRNVQCAPRSVVVPYTLDELAEAVRTASTEGRKVRLVGSGFSWSTCAATEDTMIACGRLNAVEIARDRKTAWVHCGTTNRELNKALSAAGLQVPWNGVLDNIRVGGMVSIGTHGSGKDTATMGDLAVAFDVIDANGNRRILSEETLGPAAMQAVRLSFGMFGVVARVQLRVEPACNVVASDCRMDISEALAFLPEAVLKRDLVEIFWFPFTDWVWVRTLERTDLPSSSNPHSLASLARHFVEMTVGAAGSCFARKLPALLPSISRRSAGMLRFGDEIMPLSQALHPRRWIELRRCSCVEVGFKVDPEFRNVRDVFQTTVRSVEEWAARGRYPLDLGVKMRVTGPSQALLSPAYGPGLTCFIEALCMGRNRDWKMFSSELCAKWLAEPTAVPHWAKEFEHVPGIENTLRQRLGARAAEFRRALRDSGADPRGMFVNDLVRRMFLQP